ncbi:MAG TPA: glycerol-3-phosphate 1-O-acyltransferase PlsY [Candidatus Kapabacteria bacterium]|nr:glycerol-3-phosphate 1-O-acyltransferase PlsY [Candidatus Kapabacteria bacterium]
MGSVPYILLIAIISYLLGSVPTAVIISKLFYKSDIREQGSGNMGSTNTYRVLGVKWGIFVQVVDILKGYLAVTLIATTLGAGLIIPNATSFEDITLLKIMAGISAIIGHIFPVFAGFRGGKGINTATGMLLGLVPTDVLIAFALFAIALLSSGYVSLGSIVAAFTIPGSLMLRYNVFGADIPGYHILVYFSLSILVLVLFTHRTNIKRILSGTENKFQKLQIVKLKFKKGKE